MRWGTTSRRLDERIGEFISIAIVSEKVGGHFVMQVLRQDALLATANVVMSCFQRPGFIGYGSQAKRYNYLKLTDLMREIWQAAWTLEHVQTMVENGSRCAAAALPSPGDVQQAIGTATAQGTDRDAAAEAAAKGAQKGSQREKRPRPDP